MLKHKAKAGSVVVLDARTGEVLAMTNYPSFNPADRRNLTGEQLRNRAMTDTFEPGSTMKPLIAALAMERGVATPRTMIDTTPGWINVTGSVIRDTHMYGPLTLAEVIQKSSNVGVVKLSQKLPAEAMYDLYTQVGLGQKPQIDFPGAVSGRLRPWKTWRPVEQATMAYGYGLSASLLQLARAYTVFAHDGELMPVTVLRDVGRDEAAAGGPALLRVSSRDNVAVPVRAVGSGVGVPVIRPETARAVRQMLQLAAGDGGTAPQAQAIGFSVGGKTGTARKQEGKGYGNKYRSWFVGLAPIADPRVVVAVMVDEPSAGVYFGGLVAAPVFSEVVQQTLRSMNVAPDLEVQPNIVQHPAIGVPESF